MSITNLDKETLYLKTVAIKNLASRAKIGSFDDIMSICNEFLGVLDQLPELENALKLVHLVKSLHNHVHNF